MKLSDIFSDNYDILADVDEAEEKQQPCEDEYIRVPKKALKYRTAGMVAYNAEWLKKHFDLERAVICGKQEPCEDATLKEIFCMGCEYKEQQPCDDAVSRKAAIDILKEKWNMFSDANDAMQESIDTIEALKPVTPQQKMGYWIMKHRTHNEVKYYTGQDEMGETHTISVLERYEADEPYCSECGKRAGDTSQDYCCACGTKMQGRRKHAEEVLLL